MSQLSPIPRPYAGFWVRLIADILDSVLLNLAAWAIELVLLGALFWVRRLVGNSAEDFGNFFNALWVQVLNLLIYLILAAPYYIIGHERYGTTLGKWPLGIYVEPMASVLAGQKDKRITRRQSTIRFVSYLLSYLPFGAGFFMAAFHPERRALHDLLAGTVSMIRRPKNHS